MTADLQDLKEEIRANLVSRVDALVAEGASAHDADEQAMRELGDIRELLQDAAPDDGSAGSDGAAARGPRADQSRPPVRDGQSHIDHEEFARLLRTHRVQPKPAYVMRAVLWSALVLAGLTVATLGATDVLPLPVGPIIAIMGLAATGAGLLVGDSCSQETTTNYPMPELRASGYALATWLGVFGLGIGGLIALDTLPLWCLVFAVLGVVSAVGGLVFLGVTQTNRHKSWTRTARARFPRNRFEAEPELAARFGIYTAAIWLIALVSTALVGLMAGWIWAPVPFFVGVATMLIVLARMMFGERPGTQGADEGQVHAG